MNALQIITKDGFTAPGKSIAKRLGGVAANVLSEIASLQAYHKTESVYTTIPRIAEEIGFSEYQVRKALRTLEEAGLLSTRQGRSCLHFTINIEALVQFTNVTVTQAPEASQVSTTIPLPFTYSSTSKNTDVPTAKKVAPEAPQPKPEPFNNYNEPFNNCKVNPLIFEPSFIIEKDKKKEEEKERGQKVKGKPFPARFTPPTLADVLLYANAIALEHGKTQAPKIASKFWNYYESTDWRMSKGMQVRNWQAKFNSWLDREEELYNPTISTKTKGNSNGSNSRLLTDEQNIREMQERYDRLSAMFGTGH